jgi:hypothetical protein
VAKSLLSAETTARRGPGVVSLGVALLRQGPGQIQQAQVELLCVGIISSSGIVATVPCYRPTSTPCVPCTRCSTAAAPSRVASKRSYAPGAPPRWTCPSVVTRRSTPNRP